MIVQDRYYQENAARKTLELMALKTGAVLVVQPTGTGKTVTAVKIINYRLEENDDRVTFLAPRREIVHQTADKVCDFGLPMGIVMAGHKYSPKKPVQVASVDTLRSWVKRGKVRLDTGTMLAVDEAHRSLSKTHQWLIEAAKDQGGDVFGLTASPVRGDGRGMKPTFQHLVTELNMVQAIKEGWLVQPDYRIAFVPDLHGIKVKGGDYSEVDLDRIMNQKVLVGDIVSNWLAHGCRGMPTLAFAATVKHSIAIAEEFEKAGLVFVHIDGTTNGHIRDRAIKDLLAGRIDGITNCGVFTEGTDIPNLGVIIDAGPTKSLGKHIQKWGRGSRPLYMDGHDLETIQGRLDAIKASAKPRFLVLDHAGNFYRNGRIDRNIPWELCEGKEIIEAEKEKREKSPVQFTCEVCTKVFSRQVYCPNCGTKIEKRGKMADFLDGELVALTQGEFSRIEELVTNKDKREFYLGVLHWCRTPHKKRKDENGRPVPNRKDGFAAALFKAKFGEWPPFDWRNMETKAPTVEIKDYIRSSMIRYVKGKQKEANEQGE